MAGSQVNPAAYKTLYPIHVFDVSKRSERFTEGVVDFTVKDLVKMYPQIHKPTHWLSVQKRRIKDGCLTLAGTCDRDGAHDGRGSSGGEGNGKRFIYNYSIRRQC